MNRLATLVIFLSFVTSTVFAQIPNAGFETWTGGAPDTWATSNAGSIYINLTQSSTAHGGSSSARGEVISIGGVTAYQPILQAGTGGTGFAYASRPGSITGWYQFNSVQADRFGVNVVLYKGGTSGTVIANAAVADATTRSGWYQFNVPFTYVGAGDPDLCIIQFQIIAPVGGSQPHVGSSFLLDDLAFSGVSGIAAGTNGPHTFALHQNYPNPFNPSTVLSFDLPRAATVRLSVFNLLGQEVATPVHERLEAGTHRVPFSGAHLPSGTYLVRLQADASVQVRSMTLVR